jgi:bifunctional DNase/RNase
MQAELVELRIRSVRLENGEPSVLLENPNSGRVLSIPIGPFEASALIIELEGIVPPRPLTHDLLAELFTEAGFSLEFAELFGEGGAKARLSYRKDGGTAVKEVRPSDALALALRLRAPIMAESSILKDPIIRPSLFRRGRKKTIYPGRRRGSKQESSGIAAFGRRPHRLP